MLLNLGMPLKFNDPTFLQVLHPQSMRPAREGDIPVRVKNSYNPRAPGTIITKNRDMSQVSTSELLNFNTFLTQIYIFLLSLTS